LKALDLTTIGEAGSKDFIRVNKNDSLHNLIREMWRRGKDRALVYSDDVPEGIVTQKDVIARVASSRSYRSPTSTIHVASVMTYPLIKLPEGTSVVKAARVMLERGISSIPAEKGGDVVALFSKWDLARMLVDSEEPVTTVMTARVVFVNDSDSLPHVRRLMIDQGISVLPVVNPEKNCVVGVITPTELMNALVEAVDKLSEGGLKDFLKRVTAGDMMRPLIPAVAPDDSVGKASNLIVEKSVRGVLVMEEGSVIGIVTLTDLTKYVTYRAVSPSGTYA